MIEASEVKSRLYTLRLDVERLRRIQELVFARKVKVTLAVDDQGRLARDCNVYNFIVDLKYNGGRFLSIGENIDSDVEGWELLVKVMEIHHHHANREKARQCRRGQEGIAPDLVIHRIYNGYWFWGRPSVFDLWQDLRTVTSEIRPDWDLSTPGLREAWNAGDFSRFHGWNKQASGETASSARKK